MLRTVIAFFLLLREHKEDIFLGPASVDKNSKKDNSPKIRNTREISNNVHPHPEYYEGLLFEDVRFFYKKKRGRAFKAGFKMKIVLCAIFRGKGLHGLRSCTLPRSYFAGGAGGLYFCVGRLRLIN